MHSLGRLEEAVKNLKEDFTDEKQHSAESRGRMHTKLERIEENVGIVGDVAAQARDKANIVEKLVTEDIKPVTDDVKRWRLMGMGFLGLIGIAGAAFGITVATFGDAVVSALRHFLKIS